MSAVGQITWRTLITYSVLSLNHNPPENAVVLCVDEKSQIQALDRSQPVLPMMPGTPERRTHDNARNAIASLFAAFDIADGTVISALHHRHRHQEFLAFLKKIDKNVPAELDVHLARDNYGTHKTPAVQAWMDRHRRFHMHFTLGNTDRAKNLLWAACSLAGYGMGVGLEPGPRVLLHPVVIERFAAPQPVPHTPPASYPSPNEQSARLKAAATK